MLRHMLTRLMTGLEHAASLDRTGDRLQAAVQSTVSSQRARDVMHGVWLGHPLHPVLIHAPLGAFLSAAVLDLIPSHRRSATTLIAVGTISTLPAAAAGLVDWSTLSREQRRVGLVHAASNTVALGFYAGSLVARIRGRHGAGRALAYIGFSISGGAAYLGGHLTYQQGAAVNQAATDTHRLESGWQAVTDLTSLLDGRTAVREVGDVPILLYRLGDRVTAFVERCAHQSGPLGEGEVIGYGADACVVCPWHGSTFSLRDGTAVRGPAAVDQPALQTRVVDGVVEVAICVPATAKAR